MSKEVLSKTRATSLQILWPVNMLVGRPNLSVISLIFRALIDTNNLRFHFNWESELLENSEEVFSEERGRRLYVSRYALFFGHVLLKEWPRENKTKQNKTKSPFFMERDSSDFLDCSLSGSWCESIKAMRFWCAVVLLGHWRWFLADITLEIDCDFFFFLVLVLASRSTCYGIYLEKRNFFQWLLFLWDS